MKLVRAVQPIRIPAKSRTSLRDAAEHGRFSSAFARIAARTFSPLLNEEDAIAAIGPLATADLADACWVHVLDEEGGLRLVAAWQSDAVPSLALPAAHESRLNVVLRTRRPDLPEQGALPAFLIVPLALADTVEGAMTLAFQGDGPALGPIEVSMAEDLAVHAAAAIGRSREHARALKALFSRDQSFAAAAHELGNPLNALFLQVHAVIHSGGLDPRTMARVFAMERLIKQMVDLNHRMLDTSRLAAGQFDLRLEDVDLTSLVQELLANNAEQLAWSKCPASFSFPGPVVGRWDRLRLEQVVSNLISNAMKYGFGQPISVSIEATADLAWLSVRDHGIGIAAKDHERIFERFERASTMGGSRSLGLGLWVVRQIVGALGGTIRLESSLGAGAILTVELPRAAGNAGAG
jgi:signal transduction histidine kinase